jgi:hypothetical protein
MNKYRMGLYLEMDVAAADDSNACSRACGIVAFALDEMDALAVRKVSAVWCIPEKRNEPSPKEEKQ